MPRVIQSPGCAATHERTRRPSSRRTQVVGRFRLGHWPFPKVFYDGDSLDIFSVVLFPLLVVCLGLGLIYSHVDGWRAAKESGLSAGNLDFQWRRFRRRVQASGMVVLLGAALAAGQLISPRRHPSLFVYFWAGVFLLAVWVVLLALADAVSSRQHLTRLRHQQLIETAKLQAELRRQKQPIERESKEPLKSESSEDREGKKQD